MNLPNFLVIGAAKAGTTSLYAYLKQHPQVYMSPMKGTGFFDCEGEKLNYQGPGDMQRRLPINNLKDYCAMFKGVSGEIAIGEACTDYLYSAKAPERIYHYIPDVKLIAILRDPAQRAYSQYIGNVRDGYEPQADFAQALAEEEERIVNNWHLRWHYKQRGFYYTQLKRYFKIFDPKQIKVFLYEDYLYKPKEFLKDIFKLLEVDDTFIPNMDVKRNVSKTPKNEQIYQSLTFAKDKLPFGKTMLNLWLERILPADKPKLAPEIRQQLISDYQEDILKLQNLIERDLSRWLQ